jgi:hypothetical protein
MTFSSRLSEIAMARRLDLAIQFSIRARTGKRLLNRFNFGYPKPRNGNNAISGNAEGCSNPHEDHADYFAAK